MVLLLKSSLVLFIVWAFYKLLLAKESFFSINRIYLLLGLLFAFVLPFISLPEMVSHQGIFSSVLKDAGVVTSNVLTESGKPVYAERSDISTKDTFDTSSITGNQSASRPKGTLFWMFVAYAFGVFVLSIRFMGQLFTLFRWIRTKNDRVVDGATIIINSETSSGPCSFFNHIFIAPEKYGPDVYDQILEHEKVHVRKWHSLDLLVAELVCIVLWFNPFAWYYRREIEKNIEYQTDDFLLRTKTVEAEKYQLNLLEVATQQKPLTLVSSYNQSLIKKRIIMMNSKKSNPNSYFKYAFIAPILFSAVLFMNQPFLLNAQENAASYNYQVGGDYDNDEYQNGHSEDQTPLMRAAADGQYETVKTLIANGADINEMLDGEGTALYTALEHSHFEIAKLLLNNGADPNLGSGSDGYPIMAAIANGDEDMVRMLIQQGADVNKTFPGDGNAMIQAARYGVLEIMKILVAAGADIDAGVAGDGNPLIMAAKGGQLAIVKYLVGLGANVNAEVIDDETPLINASEQGHLAIVTFLVNSGAKVNQSSTDSSGRYRSPLKMAKDRGHTEITEYLRTKGAKE